MNYDIIYNFWIKWHTDIISCLALAISILSVSYIIKKWNLDKQDRTSKLKVTPVILCQQKQNGVLAMIGHPETLSIILHLNKLPQEKDKRRWIIGCQCINVGRKSVLIESVDIKTNEETLKLQQIKDPFFHNYNRMHTLLHEPCWLHSGEKIHFQLGSLSQFSNDIEGLKKEFNPKRMCVVTTTEEKFYTKRRNKILKLIPKLIEEVHEAAIPSKKINKK